MGRCFSPKRRQPVPSSARFGITIDRMAQAPETPRTGAELEAREELMRQQFERDAQAWEEAVPAGEVLAKLEARISPAK